MTNSCELLDAHRRCKHACDLAAEKEHRRYDAHLASQSRFSLSTVPRSITQNVSSSICFLIRSLQCCSTLLRSGTAACCASTSAGLRDGCS